MRNVAVTLVLTLVLASCETASTPVGDEGSVATSTSEQSTTTNSSTTATAATTTASSATTTSTQSTETATSIRPLSTSRSCNTALYASEDDASFVRGADWIGPVAFLGIARRPGPSPELLGKDKTYKFVVTVPKDREGPIEVRVAPSNEIRLNYGADFTWDPAPFDSLPQTVHFAVCDGLDTSYDGGVVVEGPGCYAFSVTDLGTGESAEKTLPIGRDVVCSEPVEVEEDDENSWISTGDAIPVEWDPSVDTSPYPTASPSGLVTLTPALGDEPDEMALFEGGAWRVVAQPPLCGRRGEWRFERHESELVGWTTSDNPVDGCSSVAVLADGSWMDRTPDGVRLGRDSVLIGDEILDPRSGAGVSLEDGSTVSIPPGPTSPEASDLPTIPVVRNDSLMLVDSDGVSTFDLNARTWERSDPNFWTTGSDTATATPEGLIVVSYDGEAAILTAGGWEPLPDIPLTSREGGFAARTVKGKAVVGRPSSVRPGEPFAVLEESWTIIEGPPHQWFGVTVDDGDLVAIGRDQVSRLEVP